MKDTVPTRPVVRKREYVQAVRVHPESLYLTREVIIALTVDSSKAMWLIAPEAAKPREQCAFSLWLAVPHVTAY